MTPDTIYEFRVAYRNDAGNSDYSLPSRRAKTNHAELPSVCNIPTILEVGVGTVKMLLDLPHMGIEPVTVFIVEAKDSLSGFGVEHHLQYQNPVSKEGIILNAKAQMKRDEQSRTFVIKELKVNTHYKFRVRAESDCGMGPYSQFTDPIIIPAVSVI